LITSINFSNLEKLQRAGKWRLAENIIFKEVGQLIKSGADIIGICSNTGNECAERIQRKIKKPLIHIADPIGIYLKKNNIKNVGLIGTIYTMEKEYIKEFLEKNYKVKVFIPDKKDRVFINRVIYEELCRGIIKEKSRRGYLTIMNKIIKLYNLDGFILGCTEIPLLINQKDISIKLIDSTKLHAEYLAKKSL